MRKTCLLALMLGAYLVGCTGPKELTNADVEAQKKQFSQENYEKSMKDSGKGEELDRQKAADAEQGDRGH